MSEGLFNVVQFGQQTAVATAVDATTKFPVDTGFLGFELDRANESPDEDFGSTSREYPGRETYGVRWATASLPFVGRFEDFMHVLNMHVDANDTPVGAESPYVWTYAFDETGSLLSTAVTPYTIEYGVDGSTQDEFEALGVVADTLDFGFDALSAPGNSMWRGTLGLVALNRYPAAITGALTVPTVLENMEGHNTTFAEGTGATAFASLSALTGSLKQFSFSSSLGAAGRVYGGSDTATAIGRSQRGEITFDALIGISATSDTNILDIYQEATNVVTERRWRLTIDGDGVNSMTIDFRPRFRAVNIGEHEGERLYAVNGVWVYDATLASRGTFTLTNAVATLA